MSDRDSLAERLLARANEIYAENKRAKHPYTAPELLPQTIESDQVKAVLEACVEEIVNIRAEIERCREVHRDDASQLDTLLKKAKAEQA